MQFSQNCSTTVKLFSVVTMPFYIPTKSVQFQFLHALNDIWFSFFCGCSNPSRYEMMYHCGTDFHVPNNYDIGHFNVLTGHFI